MNEQEILNELRHTLEFLERQAMNLPPSVLREEFAERATGLRPVVKQLEGK